MQRLAHLQGALFKPSSVQQALSLSHRTLQELMACLQHLYLIHLLPLWHHSHARTMGKTSKLYCMDTGLVAALRGVSGDMLAADGKLRGALFEGLVFTELYKQLSWQREWMGLYHFRTSSMGKEYEVDFVIERQSHIVGIEVKASTTVDGDDFKGLRYLRDLTKERLCQWCGAVSW